MPVTFLTATIPAGQSVSSSLDLSDGVAEILHMSPEWTPSQLSFLVSFDNVSFSPLVDETMREITMNVAAGTAIRIAPRVPANAGWLKFRSGSRAAEVIQTSSRNLTVTIGKTSGP